MTATPPIVDRETWQKEIDTQRVRERATPAR
jgi:GH25 family lysozyme M1 (1,4-beta-N-acetylmuramidase)